MLARSSRRTQAKNNGTRDMLNVGTGNLHDGSSWVVSHHSTVLKWTGVFRQHHGDLLGLGRRQVVTYRTKKERRGTENRTKAWAYIYMPKIQILQKYPRAHTIYP